MSTKRGNGNYIIHKSKINLIILLIVWFFCTNNKLRDF